MDLRELVDAVVARDALSARQWIADSRRAAWRWQDVEEPHGMDRNRLAVAAGIVELMAERQGADPPAWTSAVPAAPEPMFLVHAAERLPRLRRMCEEDGPEPLRRRGLFAPPNFLTAA